MEYPLLLSAQLNLLFVRDGINGNSSVHFGTGVQMQLYLFENIIGLPARENDTDRFYFSVVNIHMLFGIIRDGIVQDQAIA